MSKAKPIERALPAEGGERVALPRDDFDRDVWSVFGVPVDAIDLGGAIGRVDASIRDRQRLSFVTPNLNWLMRGMRDRQARQSMIDADLSLADGAPVARLARLAGAPIRGRVAGADLFEALVQRALPAGRRPRVFFFGGRPGSAARAAAALEVRAHGVESAGFLDPGSGDVNSMSGAEFIDYINSASPDFVVVALGAAKGQDWIDRNQSRLTAPVIAHLGAVVDFTSGAIRRAPDMVRRLGLEWLWRILQDPALWRRYVGDVTAFASLALLRLRALRPAGRPAGRAASAQPIEAGGTHTLRLEGDLLAGELVDIRAAFRSAARRGDSDIRLDLSAAGAVDSAFLGLCLMLEKALRAKGAGLVIAGASGRLAHMVAAHGFSLDTRPVGASEAESPALPPAAPARARRDLLA